MHGFERRRSTATGSTGNHRTAQDIASSHWHLCDQQRKVGEGAARGDQTTNDDARIPFGGVGWSGPGARFGGEANIDAFTETRWITVRSSRPVHRLYRRGRGVATASGRTWLRPRPARPRSRLRRGCRRMTDGLPAGVPGGRLRGAVTPGAGLSAGLSAAYPHGKT
ncbi:hypothetical protein [Streptomyces sp. NPDC017940]|uniref:hypothetical protein n=1 Tax=Streptomyces sp. NPDC017940 TaxID=3365017 RepID=UPI0037B76DDC